jgi:hypothetical protein
MLLRFFPAPLVVRVACSPVELDFIGTDKQRLPNDPLNLAVVHACFSPHADHGLDLPFAVDVRVRVFRKCGCGPAAQQAQQGKPSKCKV